MPDGAIANCYAEDVADRLASHAYPQGFEHHYWTPKILGEPARVTTPSKIFVGSMADVFGHWVPDDQIEQVLNVARSYAPWHTYIFLTKNPKRLLTKGFTQNCWLGASSPPDFMWNKPLNADQRERMLRITLETFEEMLTTQVTWLSAEPLSWDITPVLEDYPYAIDWIVIGAASNGKTYYPPEEYHVRKLVEFCDEHDTKVFFKGNLHSLPYAAANWREEFPAVEVQA